jgi:hypothetical protein
MTAIPAAFETDDLAWVVREQANLSHPEVHEDLRPKTVVTEVYGKSELFVGLNRIESLFLKLVSMDFGREADSAAFLPHINENACAGLFDLGKGLVQLRTAIAPFRAEDVARETLAVDANQGRLVRVDIALDECKMVPLVHGGTVEVQQEFSVVGRQGDRLLTLDQLFLFAAIGDQVLNTADFQPVLFLELEQLGQPGH